ncbi:MFS transporter [Erwinia sp. BNK-24-b]|uniref:MFS transporter n=1 Tax=Erwinia TaxID=551 RepID=UPI001FED4018|nr:MFS transporter [Erwinia phyllosphaerae]MBV4366132.1 MFS transporter [Erwinia phyllosphaerae]
MRSNRPDPFAPREWAPGEKPMLPGSPSTPLHPTHKRIAFGIIGLLISITGALSNALVTANLSNLQGVFGAYSNEIAWLPAVYVMGNISINLLLVKFRQQFGLRAFTEAFLVLYALVSFFHLLVNDLSSAIIVRAAHGMVGAALSSLGIYYQTQAWPAKHRLKALTIGLGASQLAIPLARLFSSELLQLDEWRGLYLFELGLAMICLGAVLILKLPPGDRIKVFEKKDFLTFMLMAPGMALFCGVLSLGRIEWWTSTPWLGICLALGLVLVIAAVVLEHNRSNPLINTRWLRTGSIFRLGIVMIMLRVTLAEQNTGAIGYLQQIGLLNDQMQGLALAILLGVIAGITVSALTINVKHLSWPIVISLLLIMVASLMDAHSSPVTRGNNMYISQFLLGFSSTFFIAPALLLNIGSVVTQPKNLVSLVVLFGMSQNLGGLIGSALLGTFQTWREKYHSSLLGDQLSYLDSNVTDRLAQYSSLYSSYIGDPALLSAQSTTQLQSVATLQANVLAYNDTYLLTAAMAFVTLIWVLWRLSRLRYLNWQQAKREAEAERRMQQQQVRGTNESAGTEPAR